MATTAAVTPTTTATRAASEKAPISPSRNDSQVRTTAAGKVWMIEKKIIRDIPLPIPCSVICSPSHITKSAPTVSVVTVVNVNKKPGLVTAPGIA